MPFGVLLVWVPCVWHVLTVRWDF